MTLRDVIESSYELHHRARRARLLAEAARKLDVSAEQAVTYPPRWWADLARVIHLGGNDPSRETITRAVGNLASPDLVGLVMPDKAVRVCTLCNEPLGSDDPVERHLGQLVHSACLHHYEEGWEQE